MWDKFIDAILECFITVVVGLLAAAIVLLIVQLIAEVQA